MKITIFPTLEEVVELHTILIKRFGGQLGIRDLGLLESALLRPQSGYYETLSLQAAALFQSLALNHPFIDGNKRVAFATVAIFLKLNGYTLKLTANDGEKFLIQKLIERKEPLEKIADWLEKRMK